MYSVFNFSEIKNLILSIFHKPYYDLKYDWNQVREREPRIWDVSE